MFGETLCSVIPGVGLEWRVNVYSAQPLPNINPSLLSTSESMHYEPLLPNIADETPTPGCDSNGKQGCGVPFAAVGAPPIAAHSLFLVTHEPI
jgi:hypothetical protein